MKHFALKNISIIKDRYLVLNELGTGGSATVFKAWDSVLQRYVALKKIHGEYSGKAKFIDLFKSEALHTAKLDHENIIRVFDFIDDINEGYFIVMDYVRGVDLHNLITTCRNNSIHIPDFICLYITSEVLKALDYAHDGKDELTGRQFKIVHRDISPSNIMLYLNGKVKLTDFGIAQVGDSAERKIKEEERLSGKISYMSPEQAQGSKKIDARSDLFSCGIILYEMLTGEKAFKGKHTLDVWNNVKNAKIDFKNMQKSDTPLKLQEILIKVLQRSPDSRYSRAIDMYVDIKRYLNKVGNTQYLEEEHIKFLSNNLAAKFEEVKKERNEDLNKDYSILVRKAAADKKNKLSISREGNMKTVNDKFTHPKERTVMDVRHHAKKDYFKSIKIALSLFTAVLFLLAALDINLQLTSLGSSIHNAVWKPALVIDTKPSGAIIEILKDGVDIITRDGYRSITPTNIADIRHGQYILRLSHNKYGRIERKLVIGGKISNDLNVTIPNSSYDNGVYTIAFEKELTIISEPAGADLIIDGKNVGTTPAVTSLEFGKYIIELYLPGYLSWKEKIDVPLKDDKNLTVIFEKLPETQEKKHN